MFRPQKHNERTVLNMLNINIKANITDITNIKATLLLHGSAFSVLYTVVGHHINTICWPNFC